MLVFYYYNPYNTLLLKDINSIKSITYKNNSNIETYINKWYNNNNKPKNKVYSIFCLGSSHNNSFCNDENFVINMLRYFFNYTE